MSLQKSCTELANDFITSERNTSFKVFTINNRLMCSLKGPEGNIANEFRDDNEYKCVVSSIANNLLLNSKITSTFVKTYPNKRFYNKISISDNMDYNI